METCPLLLPQLRQPRSRSGGTGPAPVQERQAEPPWELLEDVPETTMDMTEVHNALMALTVAEIREELRAYGESTTGIMIDLVRRLASCTMVSEARGMYHLTSNRATAAQIKFLHDLERSVGIKANPIALVYKNGASREIDRLKEIKKTRRGSCSSCCEPRR